MPSTLVFPNGVRLALKHEIPGPESNQAALWARVESANIGPGFTIKPSNDARFSHYAEINVDAPQVWTVFYDLCHALLRPNATLVAGEVDADLLFLGPAALPSLILILERHKYQLVHDGSLQFGLLDDQGGMITEVVLAPAKHFQVWLNDEKRFRSIMEQHGLQEDDHIQFLEEYPYVTIPLSKDGLEFPEPGELLKHLKEGIDTPSRRAGH